MSHFKITKSSVDALAATGLHWDTDLSGFGIRMSGLTKSYFIQARCAGKESRITIGRHGVFTAEQARKRAKELLLQMASGVDPKEADRASREAKITLQEVFDAYISHRQLAPRTLSDYRGYMVRYFDKWASLPVVSITADMVQKKHRSLGADHGEAQGNVAFRFFRSVVNYAQGMYTYSDGSPLIPVNPTKRLNATGQWFASRRRTNYITEETLSGWHAAVLQLCNVTESGDAATMRDYLLFLLFTGLRRDEASKIEWDHVDLDGGRYVLPAQNTKNRTEVVMPLTSVTQAMLTRRNESRSSNFVFPSSGKSGRIVEPRSAINKVTALCGVSFSPHDLRRSFATYADTAIDDHWTVKRLMNHHTGQDITQRYMQGVQRLRAPAQQVTDYILHLISKKD